jgi:tetratricopeptide (TPR) repeat protein
MIWLLALQLAVAPARHYENARQDFNQRKFSEAIREVDFALHQNPYMVPALVLKARLATLTKHPDIAKNCLITAITIDPTSEEAQFYLGVLYFVQNEFGLALSPLQAAQQLAPKGPLPAFYLAMTHQGLGNASKALELYERAESLSPEKSVLSAEILVAHGRFLLSLGRTQEGIEKVRRAIEMNPGSREAHYQLAKGLDHEGDFKDAAAEGERALTLPEFDVGDAQIHFLLATVYRKLNQPALAKAHMDKFLAARKTAEK